MSFGDVMSSHISRVGSMRDRKRFSSTHSPDIHRKVLKVPTIQALRVQERESSLHHQILHTLYDAIIVTDSAGAIHETNARAEQFLRYSREELHSSEIINYIFNADQKLLDEIRKSVNGERYTLMQASCIRKDRSLFPAEIAISQLKVGTEERLCFLIRDITERKKAEKLLLKAQEERLESEKMKARLSTVSTLSYELNNPLQMLLSMTEKDGNASYQQQINRIIAVLREVQKQDVLKKLVGADGAERFELDVKEVEVRCTANSILIVDDEELMVTLFKDVLTNEFPKATVASAHNGQIGLENFAAGHHKVVILDVAMPVMNGEEACAKMTALCDEKGWEMPHIIFCTGFVPPEGVAKLVGDGSYHSLLSKPFHMNELSAMVNKFLSDDTTATVPSV